MQIQFDLNIENHNDRDPSPWLALFLDNSIPIDENTKKALMADNNSHSARYLLPIINLWSKITMFFIHILKFLLPRSINASLTLHKILAWGLKTFVSPNANLLIFRHFHIGSEILSFISANIHGTQVPTSPLMPYDFNDVKDELFLKHDLNLYNFVIRLNSQLRNNNISIQRPETLNTDMITEGRFNHIIFPDKWTNLLDLRSAIALFTPFYQLFLTRNDFIRASNSLQLDETIAIYTSQILGSPAHISLVNNKHPMVPRSTYNAAYNLVLHGLAAETLHEILVNIKNGYNPDGVLITHKNE